MQFRELRPVLIAEYFLFCSMRQFGSKYQYERFPLHSTHLEATESLYSAVHFIDRYRRKDE